MKKRGAAGILLAAIVVTALGGCGQQSGESSQQLADSNAQQIEFLSQKSEDVDLFDDMLKEFMELNTDVVMTQTVTNGSVSLASRVASNDIPDLINVYASTSYREMAKEGLFLDLRGEEFLDKIPQEYLDLFTLEDGTIWGLPVNVNAVGLYINEEIYEECGLEVPETFDQLLSNCEALEEAGYNPFVFPYKDAGALRQPFERYLAGCVDHDFLKICEEVGTQGKSFADYPSMVTGLKDWAELMGHTAVDPVASDVNDMVNAFANGETAMIFYSVAALSQIKSISPELDFYVYVMPSATGIEATVVGTPDMVFAINKDSESTEACKRFLEWFMEDENIEYFTSRDMVPTITKGVEYQNEDSIAIWNAIAEGKFTISPTVGWANGYQDAFKGELQEFVMERDVDAFIGRLDTMTKDIYGQQ